MGGWDRSRMARLLELLVEDRRRTALESPAAFRRAIVLDPDDAGPLAGSLQTWQAADFAAVDAAWQGLAGSRRGARRCVRRAYLERPRGHSKTTDTAVQIAWILNAARRPVQGLAAAADRDQAGLLHRAIRRLISVNRPVLDGLTAFEDRIVNGRTGSRLRVISSDVASSFGELPDFVICDELCHWRNDGLWQSLFSAAAKKPECVLIVLSNAGLGRGWQWDVRESARVDPAWYFSSLQGPQAPWITEESLAEQRRLLPPAVFARLWLNAWQHSDGEFVSLEEAAACCDGTLEYRFAGEPRRDYVAAIDYAEKRDLTVGCVCHREGERVIVDRMDVVRPAPGRPTLVEWVDRWMQEVATAFEAVEFLVDDYQLAATIQRLSGVHRVERFRFAGGGGNDAIARNLRLLILNGRIRWYPGCGIVAGEEDRRPVDSLETELASLKVQEYGDGRFRFTHVADGRHHDDRAFALGAAALKLAGTAGGGVVWDVRGSIGV